MTILDGSKTFVTNGHCDARVRKIWAGSTELTKELIGRDLGL